MKNKWTEKGMIELQKICMKYDVSLSVAEKLLMYFADWDKIQSYIDSGFSFSKNINGIGAKTEKHLLSFKGK